MTPLSHPPRAARAARAALLATLVHLAWGCSLIVDVGRDPTPDAPSPPDALSSPTDARRPAPAEGDLDPLLTNDATPAPHDLAPPDLAPPDLAPPDLAPPDLAPPDLAPPPPPPPDCSRCLAHYVNCSAVCMNTYDAASQGNGYAHGVCVSQGGRDLATCCRCSEPMPFKACARCLAPLGASSCAEACGQARSYCQTPYSEDPGNCCACVP